LLRPEHEITPPAKNSLQPQAREPHEKQSLIAAGLLLACAFPSAPAQLQSRDGKKYPALLVTEGDFTFGNVYWARPSS
jgi:hypothetical protein